MIIGISGKMGSGKSTLADGLEHEIRLGKQPVKIQRLKFANMLYQLATSIQEQLNVPVEKDRELLQYLGSHYRKKYGPNFWAERIKSSIIEGGVVIIDDVRFPEEAAVIKDMGGFLIRLDCPDAERGMRIGNQLFLNTSHQSETALDDYEQFNLRLNSEVAPVHALLKIVLTNLRLK